MPLREYVCQKCGYEFEELEFSAKDKPKACPNCGSDALKAKISAGAFRIDGNFSCPAPAKSKAVVVKEAGETAPTPWQAEETLGMAVINPGLPEGGDA